MAAYGITLLDWRGQIPILVLILIGIFIPYQAVLVPLSRFWALYLPLQDLLAPLYALPFIQPAHAQLVQLIITHVGYGIPICTLLFRSYYQSLPGDLVEAAQIDGASVTSIYRRIVLPLSTPMIGVVLIYQFTQIWNEFLFALTIIGSSSSPAAPITLILSGLGTSLSGTDFGVRMAGALIAALPTLVIYVLFAEQFAQGLETDA
jgi:glucose/mannose transport system permease protein